ncbi:MAG: sodium:solute symporter [Thermoguttaceae bacterium]|nr:sodium:solute symporter [Thermoguttaceae bacterium]
MWPRLGWFFLAGLFVGVAFGEPNVAWAAGPGAAAAGPSGTSVLEGVDWGVIAFYFLAIAALAAWSFKKSKDTAADYFLAGRNLGWFIIAASIFSSNIGSEHLVGLAGSGCTSGVAMAHYELHAWCLLVLAWVFIPFYARSMVFTMPEFLEKRYSPNARWVLSVISLVAYVVTKIAVGIFAGGIVFSTLLPELKLNVGGLELDSFWLGSVAVIILTGLYTVVGGLRAVAYTDTLQTVIFIIGSALVTVFGLMKLGGWGELYRQCGSDMFNLWKPLVPEGMTGTWEPVKESTRIAWYFNDRFPWLGMLFCAPIVGLWYWCTDQYIVQRALGAPNERVARRGVIGAAMMKLLPVFIFIIPGMICFALAQSGKVDALRRELVEKPNAAAEEAVRALGAGKAAPSLEELVRKKEEVRKRQFESRAQHAFPLIVAHVLPAGVRGLVVAGLLSALMSSLAGVFNACSTLFTMDFYRKFRPGATQHELVWTGRIATTTMVLIGLAWIPVIRGQEGLYYYLQAVQGYLAPPIFIVFFLGVFMKRLNSKGCLAALLVGFALGIFRLAVDTPVLLASPETRDQVYAAGSFLWIVNNIYFQYYSVFIAVVCATVMLLVSYMTQAPSPAQIEGLTFGTVTEEQRQASRASWNWVDLGVTLLVLAGITAAYLYFRG